MRNLLLFFLFFVLLISACTKTQQKQPVQDSMQTVSAEDVSSLNPKQIMILYFQSWNDEQYDVMYSLISDGFKKIEPTAKTPDDFRAYMEKFFDTSLGIAIIDSKENYKNENEAGVEYKIEITKKDSAKIDFNGTYTLKKRSNGWKLIHPYGENIDTS